MLGRRKHSRLLLVEPVDGSLRVREEVAIEHWSEEEVVVLSPEPCRADERFSLEIPGHARRPVNVRVSESRPAVTDDGSIRHRLRLVIEGDAAETVSI